MERYSFTLYPNPPFSFELACRYLRGSPGTILERVEPHAYRRAVMLAGRPALVAVRPGAVDGLVVTVTAALAGEADAMAAVGLVTRLFGLQEEMDGLLEVSRRDPVFEGLVKECWGLRPILLPSPFETLVWAVLGQQVNVGFAAKTKRALAERYGERLVVDGKTYLIFPSPKRLAAANEADLAGVQLSRQKVRYLKTAAEEVLEGRLDLEALRGMPAPEAQAALQALVGVGRWTAEYVLLRGYGHRDVIPAGDAGLQTIIGQDYGLGRKATEAEVREIAERWAGWRGYAAFYWWCRLQSQRHGAP